MHGDMGIDNVILRAAELGVVSAVVDWEMTTIVDPLADLGLHLVSRLRVRSGPEWSRCIMQSNHPAAGPAGGTIRAADQARSR